MNTVTEVKKVDEQHRFMFCDKILGSYIHCINHFTIETEDCKHIYHALSKLELCKINRDVLNQISYR
jgi:hypothetical protein